MAYGLMGIHDETLPSSETIHQDTNLQKLLHMSTSYHPQPDGQTERVNQCLENYLRCMAFLQPKKWMNWLSLAEWWYNISNHLWKSHHSNHCTTDLQTWSLKLPFTQLNKFKSFPQSSLLNKLQHLSKQICWRHKKEWNTMLTKRSMKEPCK